MDPTVCMYVCVHDPHIECCFTYRYTVVYHISMYFFIGENRGRHAQKDPEMYNSEPKRIHLLFDSWKRAHAEPRNAGPEPGQETQT